VTLRGAEAPLFHGVRGGREIQIKVRTKIKIKPNVKDNGPECPFHMGAFSAVPTGLGYSIF
jgi:hypothetical protein